MVKCPDCDGEGWTFNQTNVELKFATPFGAVLTAIAFNQTNVELKSSIDEAMAFDIRAFNQTNVELKYGECRSGRAKK